MDIDTFKQQYTPATVAEKDKKVLPDDGYALVEAIYELANQIGRIKFK